MIIFREELARLRYLPIRGAWVYILFSGREPIYAGSTAGLHKRLYVQSRFKSFTHALAIRSRYHDKVKHEFAMTAKLKPTLNAAWQKTIRYRAGYGIVKVTRRCELAFKRPPGGGEIIWVESSK